MPQVGAQLRRHLRELRGQLRYWMGLLLQRLFRRKPAAGRLDPREIRSVLVGRINGRLGNTLFLTPMIERLHALLPDAQIDLALSYPHAASLLAGTPGVRRVIVFPHKGRGILTGYLRALRQLRTTRYDLVIDPTPFSTSGRLLLSVAHARFRLGFSLPSQWAALTHAVPMPSHDMHQGRLPAFLVETALGEPWNPSAIRLWLPLQPREVERGREAIEAAVGAVPPERPRVGYFAHATGLKALPASWWQRFWAALLSLHPQIVPVEFLPVRDLPPTLAGSAALNLPAQRELTAAISTLSLFISADAGPMHLASTTDTPTMGLFKVTDPSLYGPLKASDRSIGVRDLTPEEVAGEVSAAWSVPVRE